MRFRAVLVSVALLCGLLVVGQPAGVVRASETGLSATASSMWQTDQTVRALAYAGGKIFVGGEFSSVRPPGAELGTGEVARSYVAAFDAGTGELVSGFDPVLNGVVWSLTASPDGGSVFVGGDFTDVDGSRRARVAKFDVASGALDGSFKPNVSYRVSDMAAYGNRLYLGGSFTMVDGVVRNRVAAVGAETGELLPFDPDVTSDPDAAVPTPPDVKAVAVSPDGAKVYLGGRFTTVGGVDNYAMAAVDPVSGAPGSFPAQSAVPTPTTKCKSGVTDIVTDGSTVYVAASGDGGGCFDGTFAANIADGSLKWRNTCLGATEAVAVVKGWLYKGSHAHDCSSAGSFPEMDSAARMLLVENLDDGAIGPWYPNTNGAGATRVGPLAMATDGQQLFVAGDFTTVNGIGQQGVTRFGATPETAPARLRTPTAVSSEEGVVKVNFRTTTDNDDETLNYSLYRSGTAEPIATYSLKSTFWDKPWVQYVDKGLTPGDEVAYRVVVTDGTAVVKSYWTDKQTVAGGPVAYPVSVAADAPINYWRLGETSGTVAADSGLFPNPGVFVDVTLGETGAIPDDGDPAAGFNGSTSNVYPSGARILGPQVFSVEAWINTTTTRGGKIIGFGRSRTGTSSSYDRHVYMANDGRVLFGVYDGSANTIRSTNALNDGQWHHVVGTFSPGSQAFYVDGALQGTTTAANAQTYQGHWKIGKDNLNGWPNQPASHAFAGTIDEVAVYYTQLPKSTVKSHYLAGGGNPAPPAIPTDETATPKTVKVAVKRTHGKSKLRVNVNPNQGSGFWRFRVKKQRRDDSWKRVGTYKTKGPWETRTIDLPRGKYRVRVAPKYGYKGATSRSIWLRR